jgi:dimethylhistidine N-methyltransferase
MHAPSPFMHDPSTKTVLHDCEPSTACFRREVLTGLSDSPKSLPCKYLYDAAGSQLFDRICELDEYYVTRAELEIMSHASEAMAAQLGQRVLLVEYGSGSGIKTKLLLDRLDEPAAYVPVEISRSHLQESAARFQARYPGLEVLPVCADFTEWFELPTPRHPVSHVAVYFPGSTIGNFESAEARRLLGQIASRCGRGGGLLIGIDLQKATATLEAAYDDSQGVTAAFSLNLLKRMQRELNAEVNIDDFRHEAIYNEPLGRIEISLVSQTDQTIRIGDQRFRCLAGERIHTEYSHKYTVDGFAALAANEGFALHKAWTDDQERFAVLHLVVPDAA